MLETNQWSRSKDRIQSGRDRNKNKMQQHISHIEVKQKILEVAL